MALSIEETFDKAAGYMWTPSEYPKKGADEDELASLRAYGLAVLDEAETGYARNYAGANESDPVAMAFEVQRPIASQDQSGVSYSHSHTITSSRKSYVSGICLLAHARAATVELARFLA